MGIAVELEHAAGAAGVLIVTGAEAEEDEGEDREGREGEQGALHGFVCFLIRGTTRLLSPFVCFPLLSEEFLLLFEKFLLVFPVLLIVKIVGAPLVVIVSVEGAPTRPLIPALVLPAVPPLAEPLLEVPPLPVELIRCPLILLMRFVPAASFLSVAGPLLPRGIVCKSGFLRGPIELLAS